ncbi:substrate-binding domain-containing protein [Halobacterium noricense]|uniref:substrate-binding domain-containing protein n=1 Tax=Halobacterium noricense TaxID=223182 RepID=UPI001E5F8959|nr:substrate-binding domain-containing protein [Halobacterium noricense]UHH24372.1 substrate-binding domain-containing protein [Halobacterium noricense]
MDRRRYLQALGVGGALSLTGCLGGSDGSSAAIADQTLTVAAATTVNDSGLLGDLSAGFEDAFGTTVRAVVRGTSAALRTARDGNCDVVFVHARPLEDEFLRAGYGVNRRAVMVNDFLVVGPSDNPAGAAGSDPLAAFRAIAASDATFLSRGDRSGTHVRERRLWDEAGVEPTGNWYRETGQGMGATLIAAGETGAYTLVDRGTFLNTETGLAAHVARGLDDPPDLLRNEYAVIPTNPARHDVAYALAMAFVGYLTGPGQGRIEAFRVDGERAFRPLARSEEPEFDQYVPSDWAP